MEVCRRSSWLFTLLGVILLAEALQGVQGEVEIEGPSESECRPYIEKALRELEHVGGGDADVGQSNEESSSIDNLSIDEKQSDEQRSQETSEIDIETQESIEKDAEATSPTEEADATEVKTDESVESVTEDKEEEEKKTESEETTSGEVQKDKDDEQPSGSEESDGQSQENAEKASAEVQMNVEEVEATPVEASKETTEDTASVEEAVEPPTEETGSEPSTENEGVQTQETSTEEEKLSEESSREGRETVDDTLQGETGTETSAEEEKSIENPPESGENADALDQPESNEKEEETRSDEVRTSSETVEETSDESKSDKSDDVTGEPIVEEIKSEADEDNSSTTDDEKSNEPLEQQDVASAESSETIREKREVSESNELNTEEKTEEENKNKEDTQTNSVEHNEDSKGLSKEEVEDKDDSEDKESVENTGTNEDNINDAVESNEATKSEEADSKNEESKEDEVAKQSNETNIDSGSNENEEVKSQETADDSSSVEKGSTEDAPEEELINGMEIPDNLRPRGHVEQLLKLDKEATKTEEIIDRVSEITLRELKRLYENAIKPLETLYKYRDLSNRHYGDAEIFSKPLILFMGPWSGGKSSIINYLLNVEYNDTALRTGAEPSPAYFNLLMYGEEEEVLDGTQLAADYTFSGLQKFGQGLEERLRGLKLKSKLLEKVNIVEIPGILEVRKQISRVFPFNDACQWFIDRADIIFLVYDPFKLDVGPETEAILDQLKGREYQTRIVLNKADQVKPEELMRVQGALIWNISPLMSSPQPPVMYTTSLWSRPYEQWAPVRLLHAQERAFLRDLRSAVDKRIENKIASARRFAVRVRNHAKMVDCYLTTYYNHKSIFGNKKQVSDAIIEHPQDYHIYEGLSTLTNISRYDLPDPEVYRDFFKLNPLYEFQQLSATCTYFRGCPINKLDVAIAYDLPELVGRHKRLVEAALSENSKQEQAQGS
ncbi:probable serine/threonine-protein kinase kinX [Coccinella septempunctata]|uniref:probable serine/threonine-protein kinase kinX n=1 Tax=Coccinella septempunctata TaxID=41139 RepID=UPI001D080CBF|nr:probable serine/threonine-protein kinase kinX [Coccinella septempunctata]